MAVKLSVNLNAIAMLRNRRNLPWPSVTGFARIALNAGAHGLTIHPRPDQRHIRFSDVQDIRALLDLEFPKAEFNMEGYPSEGFLRLVEKNEPDQVTLVPDDPAQATSDHGWDFISCRDELEMIVARLKGKGMRVSLFCDPDAGRDALEAAQSTGADRIECYTGPYGGSYNDQEAEKAGLASLEATGQIAAELGLGVNAGHDLTVANLPALVRALPNLLEVSIGHGLSADALEFGMAETVRRFVSACKG